MIGLSTQSLLEWFQDQFVGSDQDVDVINVLSSLVRIVVCGRTSQQYSLILPEKENTVSYYRE